MSGRDARREADQSEVTGNAYRSLLRVARLVDRIMQPYFSRFGISRSQWACLHTLHRVEQAVLTALQDVGSALIADAKDQQRRISLSEAVKSNQTAADLSMKLYTAGQIEFLNVLTTEDDLYASEDSLVQADRSIDTDLIAFYKALGGGWQAAAADSGNEK